MFSVRLAAPHRTIRRSLAFVIALVFIGIATNARAQAPSPPRLVQVYAGTATPPPASVSISPTNVSVPPGGVVQFTATVTGTANTSVVWSTTGGTITQGGSFTAPQAPGAYSISARISGGTVSASTTATVKDDKKYVDINPGENIQARVDQTPAGTAFRLKAGVHRMQTVYPRDGDTFTGEAGTIMTGARALTFTASGKYWVATGQTQQGDRDGYCRAEQPRCTYPEDLFMDDARLLHVGSLAEVAPGKWFFDYSGDKIYMSDDPRGHVVETSVTPYAFVSMGLPVTGVTISNLTIEKYATPGNQGAINAPNSTAWIVQNNEIRLNHATGVSVGDAARVLNNKTHHNGQAGIGAYDAPDVLIEGNEIWYNASLFDAWWGAGGLKVAYIRNSTIRNNYSHDNWGGGLWCDIDCNYVTFEDNLVENNEQFGIFYEISFNAVIRNNTIRGNGFGVDSGPAQAGIFVAASKNVEIYGNTLVDNASGIVGWQENRGTSPNYGVPWVIENLNVYNNDITMHKGVTGLMQAVGDKTYFTSRNNRFDRNRYTLGTGNQFAWMDVLMSESQFRSYGQEANGSFTR